MKTITFSFKKLFFILPMLAFMLSWTTFTQKNNSLELESSQKGIIFSDVSKHSPVFITSDSDNQDLVFNESETSEFEIELDFFHDYSFEDNFLPIKSDSKKPINTNYFHKSNQKLPLYDLFCNWKFHLS